MSSAVLHIMLLHKTSKKALLHISKMYFLICLVLLITCTSAKSGGISYPPGYAYGLPPGATTGQQPVSPASAIDYGYQIPGTGAGYRPSYWPSKPGYTSTGTTTVTNVTIPGGPCIAGSPGCALPTGGKLASNIQWFHYYPNGEITLPVWPPYLGLAQPGVTTSLGVPATQGSLVKPQKPELLGVSWFPGPRPGTLKAWVFPAPPRPEDVSTNGLLSSAPGTKPKPGFMWPYISQYPEFPRKPGTTVGDGTVVSPSVDDRIPPTRAPTTTSPVELPPITNGVSRPEVVPRPPNGTPSPPTAPSLDGLEKPPKTIGGVPWYIGLPPSAYSKPGKQQSHPVTSTGVAGGYQPQWGYYYPGTIGHGVSPTQGAGHIAPGDLVRPQQPATAGVPWYPGAGTGLQPGMLQPSVFPGPGVPSTPAGVSATGQLPPAPGTKPKPGFIWPYIPQYTGFPKKPGTTDGDGTVVSPSVDGRVPPTTSPVEIPPLTNGVSRPEVVPQQPNGTPSPPTAPSPNGLEKPPKSIGGVPWYIGLPPSAYSKSGKQQPHPFTGTGVAGGYQPQWGYYYPGTVGHGVSPTQGAGHIAPGDLVRPQQPATAGIPWYPGAGTGLQPGTLQPSVFPGPGVPSTPAGVSATGQLPPAPGTKPKSGFIWPYFPQYPGFPKKPGTTDGDGSVVSPSVDGRVPPTTSPVEIPPITNGVSRPEVVPRPPNGTPSPNGLQKPSKTFGGVPWYTGLPPSAYSKPGKQQSHPITGTGVAGGYQPQWGYYYPGTVGHGVSPMLRPGYGAPSYTAPTYKQFGTYGVPGYGVPPYGSYQYPWSASPHGKSAKYG